MAKKRSAKDVADKILLEQAEYLAQKWERFKAGDPTQALTDEEESFLMHLKKLEQESDLQDAQIDYLENLSDSELSDFYKRLDQSLKGPSN